MVQELAPRRVGGERVGRRVERAEEHRAGLEFRSPKTRKRQESDRPDPSARTFFTKSPLPGGSATRRQTFQNFEQHIQ